MISFRALDRSIDMSDSEKNKSTSDPKKNEKVSPKLADEAKIKKQAEQEEQEKGDDDQKGIIPEGIDFKRFLGCGG